MSKLSVLALRGVLGGACKALGFEAGSAAVEGVSAFLGARLKDPSQKVVLALQRSTERAWRAIEISLAGESLTNRLDRAEDRSFREQLRLFLDALAPEYLSRDVDFRRRALAELRAARKAGALQAG